MSLYLLRGDGGEAEQQRLVGLEEQVYLQYVRVFVLVVVRLDLLQLGIDGVDEGLSSPCLTSNLLRGRISRDFFSLILRLG